MSSYKITYYTTNGQQLARVANILPTRDLLTSLVGGYIELVYSAAEEGEDDIYCDEEGRLKGLKPNPFFPSFVGDIPLFGNVVRVTKVDVPTDRYTQ